MKIIANSFNAQMQKVMLSNNCNIFSVYTIAICMFMFWTFSGIVSSVACMMFPLCFICSVGRHCEINGRHLKREHVPDGRLRRVHHRESSLCDSVLSGDDSSSRARQESEKGSFVLALPSTRFRLGEDTRKLRNCLINATVVERARKNACSVMSWIVMILWLRFFTGQRFIHRCVKTILLLVKSKMEINISCLFCSKAKVPWPYLIGVYI